jgi:hypothetical protein
MLLKELFEAGTKHVTFCFGRMNPPTIGHEQVLNTMKSQGGDMMIFVSQSQDPKKNPLDYSTKIEFIKEMFPQYAKDVVDNASLNTVVKVASYLHEQGYTDATFVAGSDRLEDMKKLLNAYNGVEGKAHGFYKFGMIDFVSSGEREDGAEGVAGVSASGARAAAAGNDFKAFRAATGAGELAKPLFDAVRKGMGINKNLSVETVDVDRIHDEMLREHLLSNPALYENREDFQSIRKFLDLHATTEPIVNESYVYASVQATPISQFITVAHFNKNHTLVKLNNQFAYFDINGTIKRFPETGRLTGDSMSQIYFFKSHSQFEQFITLLKLKFSNYKQTSKILDKYAGK